MLKWKIVDQVIIIRSQHIFRLVAKRHKEIKINFKKTSTKETLYGDMNINFNKKISF
jgi:hypothetical protein